MTAAATDPFRLDGRRVLITGAGGGIGGALVERFAAARADVIGADRELGAMAHLNLSDRLSFDVADLPGTSRAISAYIAAKGAPDVVVSNAGFTRAELLEQLDLESWEKELAINLSGAYALVDPIVSAMAERGAGSIVFISSVNGLIHVGNPAYSAA